MALTYKCPNCGADLRFDENSQKMVCTHCGSSFDVSEVQEEEPEREEGSKVHVENDAEGPDDSGEGEFRAFECPNCGALLMTDDTTAATFCMFCGNPTLIEERLSGQKRPAYLIPFQKSKSEAEDAFRSWSKKGILTPKSFRKEGTIEKMAGVYVPFWLYDVEADADIQARATRTRVVRRGDVEYIYTDHFLLTRDVSDAYEKIPADASERMPDDVMDKLEPFDYSQLKNFEMPYLSGFLAEKYTYTGEEMKKRVESRVNDYIQKEASGTIHGYETVNITSKQVWMRLKQMKYVLLPVWMINYRYKGKDYLFAMNGQSGKYVADRPVSVGRTVGIWAGLTVLIGAIILLILAAF